MKNDKEVNLLDEATKMALVAQIKIAKEQLIAVSSQYAELAMETFKSWKQVGFSEEQAFKFTVDYILGITVGNSKQDK